MLNKIKIAILGATGKTGSHILNQTLLDERFEIVGGLVSSENKNLGKNIGIDTKDKTNVCFSDNLKNVIKDAEIIIDFSQSEVTNTLLSQENLLQNKKLIIGTTSLKDEAQKTIENLTQSHIIFQSGNMTIGIGLIVEFLKKYNKILNQEYQTIIHEIHHIRKKDSPSGTGLMLKNSLNNNSIPIHSSRAGDIKGIHEIIMINELDMISIRHEVFDRKIFAINSLKIALWLNSIKKAGLYSMIDFLTFF